MRRNTDSGRLDRRQFINGVAAGAVTLASTGVAAAGCRNHDSPDLGEVADGRSDKTYYCLQKRWLLEKNFLKLTPLKGSIPIKELYGWNKTHYSSTGTKPLQREDTSTLFLYEGPSGDVSLVMVHGKLKGDCDGGSASFTFLGLAEDGSWIVQDDEYDAPSNFDQWETEGKCQTVHWTWAGGRNDGGAYGPLDDDLYFRIDPAFNEEAELYGEEYQGTVKEWEVLSGRLDDPDRHSLWMDEGANFFEGLFSGRDHEEFWADKRAEWDDGDDGEHGDGRKDGKDQRDEKHHDRGNHGNGRKHRKGRKHRGDDDDGGHHGGDEDGNSDDNGGWWSDEGAGDRGDGDHGNGGGEDGWWK